LDTPVLGFICVFQFPNFFHS